MKSNNEIPIEEIVKKTEELHLQFLGRLHMGGRTYIKVICKIHPDKGERLIEQHSLLYKNKTCGCKNQKMSLDEFKKQTKLNPTVEIIGEYVNNGTKIKCRCKECGWEWDATPNKLQQGRGCPKCWPQRLGREFRKSQEKFEEDLREVNPTIKIVSEYQGSHAMIEYKCLLCGRVSKTQAGKLLNGESSCHYCKASLGERKIIGVLEENEIFFEREKIFESCRSKRPLPFDFYLPGFNTLIEFQGEQHFHPVDFSYTPTRAASEKAKKSFERIQERDKIKREFANQNGFNFIEINYKEMNKIEEILKLKLNL